MTAWYKQFQFNARDVEVEDEAEAEGGEPEEGDVVDAPSVLADGAPGAYSLSPPPESGDDCGEGAAGADEGEKGADEEAAGEAAGAAAAAAVPAAAAAAGP